MNPSQSALILSILLLITLSSSSSSSSDYTSFVFKGCADRNFPNSDVRTLENLVETLTSQSSAAKFYKTTTGAITGLFQCRGDLSNEDCNACVKKASSTAKKLCGRAAAVRVQLRGCYATYEISGLRQASPTDLLYKVCGRNRVGSGDRVDAALGEITKGVARGFYAGEYGSVYVLGQCEGDLGGGECVECVKVAVERAKSECRSSVLSAQIYLEQCYISYAYYPNGVPTNEESLSPSGRGKNTQKTVAIVMGGLVGAGLIMACLLFAKSAFRKKTYTYKYGG